MSVAAQGRHEVFIGLSVGLTVPSNVRFRELRHKWCVVELLNFMDIVNCEGKGSRIRNGSMLDGIKSLA